MTLAEIDKAWTKYIFVKANVQSEGCNLCLTANGERVVIPLGTKGAIHPITERIVKYMNATIALEPTVNEGQLALVHIILRKFASSLLWVLYYQTKAVRKKALSKVLCELGVKGYEPFGNLYNAELNLCFACLDFWDSHDLSSVSDQDSALAWWSQLIEEDICYQLNLPWTKGSKEDEEKAIQCILDSLNSWQNPYLHLSEELPHHFNMIESAIAIGKPRLTDNNPVKKARREFREGAWKQYKKEALHGIKRALHTHSGLHRLHLDSDELYAQTTGRNRTLVTFEAVPICLQDFLPQIGGVQI